MKIKVADLEPNPFRHMDKYPIDRAKVDALKTSIREKTFWDNLLVRKQGGKYQLAYGHHRWVALKELGIKEIDVPVRKIDDATMVQIMAEENLNWSTTPEVLVQTIQAAKEFLDKKLKKGWEDSEHLFRVLFDSRHAFEQTMRKPDGVGRNILVKFLGGNWTNRKVAEALKIIKDKTLNKEAIKTISTMEQARVFRETVKKHNISKPAQLKIAKQIVKDGVGKRDIPDLVAGHALPSIKKKQKKVLPVKSKIPSVGRYIADCEVDADDLNRRLVELIPEVSELCKTKGALGKLIAALSQLTKTAAKITTEYKNDLKRKESIL